MKNYLDLLNSIYLHGEDRPGRNSWTRAKFAQTLSFDLRLGFPAVTTKKLYYKGVVAELLWFLRGSDNELELMELTGRDRTIWSKNINAPGWKPHRAHEHDAGRIYGVQWRSWRSATRDGAMLTVDQVANLIDGLREDPYSRRHVVSAWNAGEIAGDQMCLPPCPVMFICYVDPHRGLSMHVYQRSGDMFLGVPFDIASYATLLHILGHYTNLQPKYLTFSITDAHIYRPHFDAVLTQLARDPYPLPELQFSPGDRGIKALQPEDFKLSGYKHHPAIQAEMIP